MKRSLPLALLFAFLAVCTVMPAQTPTVLTVGSANYPTIQSAVTTACGPGAVGPWQILIPATATPADTIAQVKGCTAAFITDQRTTPTASCYWSTPSYLCTFGPQPPPPTPSTGAVLTSPTASQRVTQPAGTTLAVNAIEAANYSYFAIDNFGDSITQGTGATTFMTPGERGKPVTAPANIDYAGATFSNGPTAYAYLLQADFGNAGHDYGRGGDMAPDLSYHVATWAHPTLENNPARTVMIGTNDTSNCIGTPSNCASFTDTSQRAQLYVAAQATIPDTLKTLATTCTTTGTWTADPGQPGAMYAAAAGASMTCSVQTSSPVVYVAYQKCDTTGTPAGTLAVNGAPGTLEPSILGYGLNGGAILTASGSHCSLALARNGGLAGQTNTITYTATAPGVLELLWMGGPYAAPATAVAPPMLIIGGVPWDQGDQREPQSGQFNTLAKGVYQTMLADGNNVRFADVRSYLNTTTDYTGGGGNGADGNPWPTSWLLPLHPGDRGMFNLYRAFRDQVYPQPRQSQTLNLWGGAYGSISSSHSTNGRYGADGTGATTQLTVENHSPTSTGAVMNADHFQSTPVSGTAVTLNNASGVTSSFTPSYPVTDTNFSVTVVLSGTIGGNSGVFGVTTAAPYGTVSATNMLCSITPGNAFAANSSVWFIPQGYNHFSVGTSSAGLPAGTYIWNFRCGQ